MSKRIKKKKERAMVEREITVLRSLSHPNIIKYISHFWHKEQIYIEMEFANKGDLSCWKEKKKYEQDILKYLIQIIEAVQYFHHRCVIHRDLKPKNIFLMEDKTIKIGDFGVSREGIQGSSKMTIIGSRVYMAPEVLEEEKYGLSADIWSLGCILYQLMANKDPFKGKNNRAILKSIKSRE
jgi:serine/threonine protein kinase